MMRATKRDLAWLQENAGLKTKRAATKKPRDAKRRDELPENIVEGQIIGFLRVSGWAVTKQHVGVFRKGDSYFHFGVKGDPDWRCEKPLMGHIRTQPKTPEPRPEALLMFLEIKGPGKKPALHQVERIRELRRAGFVAECFDSYEGFRSWYDVFI